MSHYAILSLAASVFTVSMGVLVVATGHRREQTAPFALTCVFIGLWTLFPFMTEMAGSDRMVVVGRLTYLAAVFSPCLFAWMTCRALGKDGDRLRRAMPVLCVMSAMFAVTLPSPLFIVDVLRVARLSVIAMGPVFHSFVLYFVILCTIVFWELARGTWRKTGHERNQLKYFLISFLIAYTGGALHFIAMYIHVEPVPHDALIIVFTALMAYAIARHRVMDVNLAARYMLIQILFALMVGLPLAGLALWAWHRGVTVAVILLLSLAAPWTHRVLITRLTRAVDRLPLFRGRYERFHQLQSHLSGLAENATPSLWPGAMLRAAATLFDAEHVIVLTRDEPSRRLLVRASQGLDPARSVFTYLDLDGPLLTRLGRRPAVWVAGWMDPALPDRPGIQNDLDFLGAEVCVPLMHQGRLFALLALGKKKDGTACNELELASLEALARAGEHALQVAFSGIQNIQLSAAWAHDLMKPFTAKGSFRWISDLRKGLLGPQSKTAIDVLTALENDARWVRDNLARVVRPSAPAPAPAGTCAMRAVYERVLTKCQSVARDTGLVVSGHPPDDAVRVRADEDAIEHRVLANLMDNALRHTPPGGTIELGHRVVDTVFEGFVRNTGNGIAPADLDRLWQPGFSGRSGPRGEAGLGLANVRSAVEAQGGRAWAESQPGGPTSFFFSLPLADPLKNPRSST